jgi:glycerol-3-phosphate cytidylyltransferase
MTERTDGLIGYTAGVFDLFHVGHLNLLRAARARCAHLVVGVTTDELALERKGELPVVPLIERMEIVQSVRYVDHVLTQVTMDKVAVWQTVKFDLVFVGDNMRGTPDWIALEGEINALGAQVVYLPYTRTASDLIGRYDDTQLDGTRLQNTKLDDTKPVGAS